MNEFLRKFDTIIFVAPLSIFRNFLRIFHFFEFEFGLVGYRPKPERPGPVSGSHRFFNPGCTSKREGGEEDGGYLIGKKKKKIRV